MFVYNTIAFIENHMRSRGEQDIFLNRDDLKNHIFVGFDTLIRVEINPYLAVLLTAQICHLIGRTKRDYMLSGIIFTTGRRKHRTCCFAVSEDEFPRVIPGVNWLIAIFTKSQMSQAYWQSQGINWLIEFITN